MVAARKIAMNVKLPSYYILFFPKQRRILLCNLPDLIGSGADDRGKLAGPDRGVDNHGEPFFS